MTRSFNANRQRALRNLRHAVLLALLFVAALMMDWRLAHAEEIKIGGTGGSIPTLQLLAEAFNKSQTETKVIIVPSLGSSGSIRAVLAGAIQIAVAAKQLKDSELGQGATAIEYARAPFVFITSPRTPVAGLTTRELADIYSGKLERWQDGTRIRLVLRSPTDSDTDIIKSISPEVRRVAVEAGSRPGMLIAVTDQDSADNVEKIPGALGSSTLSQIIAEKRPLKALKFNGVEPSAKTIADGKYPYYKRLYMVTTPKMRPGAHKFIAFVRSPAGQEILKRTEHWVVEPGAVATHVPQR
jgi:phosphate transport system substrate-binding protein